MEKRSLVMGATYASTDRCVVAVGSERTGAGPRAKRARLNTINALGHFMSLNHAYEQCLADNVVISQEVPGGLSCRRSDQEPTGSAIPADWRLAPVPRHSDRIAVRARAPNDPTNGTSTSRHQRPGGYRIVVASSGRFLRIFEH